MVYKGLKMTKPGIGGHFGGKSLQTPRQMAFYAFLFTAMLIAGCTLPAHKDSAGTSNIAPPTPREFRAVWVASVANIDWPSRSNLSVAEQKAEIASIVNRAADLNLNAIIVQVRTSADALYDSKLEPWSEYLTGEQGKAPQPFYDPLSEWIDLAHARGIELHAWFNPYRARHTSAKSPPSRSHIANTHPTAVKSYGGYLWMDPGETVAAQRTLEVILDVTRRYDIDGVHLDDYFYPYPVTAPAPSTSAAIAEPLVEVDFPDEPAWSAYLLAGGKLARADWRRQNVNQLIEKIYAGIKNEKRWVKFGVSPFGLGKPELRPPGIAGFSQYDKLYADVELWLQKGWLDYFVPQLYWRIDSPQQAYGVLLDYWLKQNTANRHVWPGLYTSRISATANANPGDNPATWEPAEILNQIALTRQRASVEPLAQGHVHFSMAALSQNRKSISDRLQREAYSGAAIVPAMPWLGTPPPPPLLTPIPGNATRKGGVSISAGAAGLPSKYAVWKREGENGKWQIQILPVVNADVVRGTLNLPIDDGAGERRYVISAIDRAGNESPRVTLAIDADGMKVLP